ncbi:Antirestriction protein (ArdA) [Desulfonispora thiosulfatigenes DSM 11270]|uniref:Antirestriction protein (ArdA) n=1 Tax=Desulfonispora thiosulfatigenes DSM 11270 TaxID=656914 RepID=A0A1W1UG48_DESTI|nr:antirestriction protein ArdA [Desulfonispora thiosulfatigenes]SMB80057.1 Antirestriction protein (ArdA) [Desulfonispora thiosulfatigenes DSM 11270]
MDITIKSPSSINEKMKIVRFPSDEERLYGICNELGIKMTTGTNCYIVDTDNKDFLGILQDNTCNIDELNYLMKRIDGFVERERKQFYASALAEKSKTMAELINLSFNTHCYSLVSDFSNLNRVGKDLYLSEKQAVATRELDELDGESFAMEVIKNNPNSTITPYGVLYKNNNEPYQVYDGRHFPPYQWQEKIATVQITAKGENEFIYLPCSDIEINKALMRLETASLYDCEVAVDSHNFPERILNIISDDVTPLIKIYALNNLANHFEQMGNKDIKYFEKLMGYVNPQTIDEILALTESMYEFEIYDGIKDAESYGRYIICESGHFEYDDNLEEYIDFKRYGGEKIANEVGAFSTNGYLVYHGHNQELSNLLSKNLGMVIPKQKEQQVLKLYMPLKITTYDVENEYGYHETVDEPLELSNYEVTNYIDEIMEAIEKDNLPEENQRGLMRYYDDHDSVNAKVSKYVFFVEMIDGELLGVAVLTLNDNLTPQELEKIKDDITGQASDGYVLKNNMGPSGIEML